MSGWKLTHAGASVSVISMEEHQRWWPGVALPTTDIQLRTYTGEQASWKSWVPGMSMRNIAISKPWTLPLVVVFAKGPCLLGRDWLCHLRLDGPGICHIGSVDLQEILTRHSEVFDADLGTVQGYQASIQVDPLVKPKFCRARSVHFALQPRVEWD